MGRFKPRELREGISADEMRRELNAAQRDLAADLATLAARSRVTELIIDGPYAARYGDVVRIAPPSGGLRVILPPENLEQPGARVTVVQEAATGALTVEAVDATVNGSDTLSFLAGIGTVEFQLTPTGWYGWSANLFTVPLASLPDLAAYSVLGRAANTSGVMAAISAGTAGHHLVRNASTDVRFASPAGADMDLATTGALTLKAFTGEVTKAAALLALTIDRATNFQASPWTGSHQFNADLRLGTLHTEASVSGAFNVTRTAGAMRVLITTTNDATLGTISGCADGIPLIVEHVEASGAPNTLTVTHDSSTANAFGCPGGVNLAIVSRGAFIAVGRGTNWKVVATTN